MADAYEIVRGKFTTAVSYFAAVSILTAFGFGLISTNGIYACRDEEYSNSSSLDDSGEICPLKIKDSTSLKESSSYWTTEVMATMFKNNLTEHEHTPLSLESILTMEIPDEVAVVILCVPVLFAVLSELCTIYMRKKQFTYSIVVELREQLEEQLSRNMALRSEYRQTNLVAKRCRAHSYRYNVSPNRNRLGRSHNVIRRKMDVLQLCKRASSIKKVAETSDFSTCKSNDSSDRWSSVLRERTAGLQQTPLALKFSCDTAVNFENARPSATLPGFSNAESWNCSIESRSAISGGVTTFGALQKNGTSSDVGLPSTTGLFLDSSAAGPSTKTPFASPGVQFIRKVEEKCNRALLLHLRQTDVPTTSLSQTYPPSGSRPVCSKTADFLSAIATGPRTGRSSCLGILSSIVVDDDALSARTPVFFSVGISRCRSMPGLVKPELNAAVQTRHYSQSWTGSLSLLCAPQCNASASSEITANVYSYNRVSRSLEDLHWRNNQTTVISTVYSSSWSPGNTAFTGHGKREALRNCSAPLSEKRTNIVGTSCSIAQSENDIFGIEINSSSSYTSVGSSENRFLDDSPSYQNVTPDYPSARRSIQIISAAKVPGADFHLGSPVGSLDDSRSGSCLSLSSELRSETSSIGSELERALFGDPEDIIAAARGNRTVDLPQSSKLFADSVGARPSPSTSAVDIAASTKCKQYVGASEMLADFSPGDATRQPLIQRASTPISCSDKFDFAVKKDGMSVWNNDSPLSSIDSNLKKSFSDGQEISTSEAQLESSESRPSSQDEFDYQFGLKDGFESERKVVDLKQYVLRPFDPVGSHRTPMASARSMSNCSSICCSPLIREGSSALEMAEEELYEHCGNSRESNDLENAFVTKSSIPHTPIRRRYSGKTQAIASLQSGRSPTFTRLPSYLHPMRNLLKIDLSAVVTQRNMRKSGRSLDSFGYILTYTPSVEEGSVPIVSWRIWKAAEKSQTLQSILVDIYGPPSTGVSDETFLRGLWNSPRNGGLAAVILDKTPSSARRALLQYLETNDDVKYTRYQVELYAQMAALNDGERMRFCNEVQRKSRQALKVLEQKRDALKAASAADDERPKKAFARFLKTLNCFRKPKRRGEELVNVCSDISALRRQLLECDEVCDEVQVERKSSIRRRQLQERILACEKALVDCVRRGLTLRSKMKGKNTGVRCYDCDVGRHKPPMIVPHIPSPLLGDHNGFSCDCPLIQDINSRYMVLDLDSCRRSHEEKLDCIQQLQKMVQVGLFRKSFLLNGQIAL